MPASECCLKIRKNYRMQSAKVRWSSHSVPDFCCVRSSIFTDYLALADDSHMRVPVSICLPAIWVLLLVLIFLVKAVKWGYLKNTQNQQLPGRSENPAKYAGILIIFSKQSFEMLNPGTQERLAYAGRRLVTATCCGFSATHTSCPHFLASNVVI